MPRETFQEVFDRMEREVQTKSLEWSTIVEFFTKRGRPLTKDQIAKLVEEDRKEREAEEAKQRAEEEAERRRNQRLIGEMEEDEDFEAFEARQRAEAAMKSKEQEDYDKAQGKDEDGDGETEGYDSEYGSSYNS